MAEITMHDVSIQIMDKLAQFRCALMEGERERALQELWHIARIAAVSHNELTKD